MRIHLPVALAASLCCGAALAAPRPAPGPSPAAAAKLAVPFVANDYARALADARQRHVPIFIDNWAMW